MLADRHEQLVVEEGDIAKVFVEDVGLGAGAEIASRPITGLQSCLLYTSPSPRDS